MNSALYVAETDEFGELVCVWVRPKGAKSARVFDPSKDSYDSQKAANFSGSAAVRIIGWLKAQSE
ncbi:hypothetical protein shim_23480 [Shimia sp. SK013]|nr:hypothetical protein shim_23480 [Shimia sp. SK013]